MNEKENEYELMFGKPNNPEYVLCAAIHFNDYEEYEHQPRNIERGYVICGRRHHNIYATVMIINGKSMTAIEKMTEANGKAIQGFLTSKDRFLNREEAGKLAYEMKQITKITKCLFSEDLY